MENIVITPEDLKDYLTTQLEREPTQKELEAFRDCVIRDQSQWLTDNAKWYVRNELGDEKNDEEETG